MWHVGLLLRTALSTASLVVLERSQSLIRAGWMYFYRYFGGDTTASVPVAGLLFFVFLACLYRLVATSRLKRSARQLEVQQQQEQQRQHDTRSRRTLSFSTSPTNHHTSLTGCRRTGLSSALRVRSRSDSLSLDGMDVLVGDSNGAATTTGSTGGWASWLWSPPAKNRHRICSVPQGGIDRNNSSHHGRRLLSSDSGNNNRISSADRKTTEMNGTSATTSCDVIRTTDLPEAERLLHQIWEHDYEEYEASQRNSQNAQRRGGRRGGSVSGGLDGNPLGASSNHSQNNRSRSGTISSTREQSGSRTALASLRLRGPAVDTIEYRTITPPSWVKASQQRKLLLPSTSSTSTSSISNSTGWDGLSRAVALHLAPPLPSSSSSSSSLPLGTALLTVQKCLPASSSSTTMTTVSSVKPTSKHSLQRPVTEISVHVQQPPEGGVLEIYTKEIAQASSSSSPLSTAENSSSHPDTHAKEESWTMEHTFDSAAAAAQFQLDLMALQVLGPTIHVMYQALCLIHQGSMAHIGSGKSTTEPVLHGGSSSHVVAASGQPMSTPASGKGDTTSATSPDSHSVAPKARNPDSSNGSNSPAQADGVNEDVSAPVSAVDTGVAWDDVMRCLGSSFPSIRIRLEVLWWLEIHGSLTPETRSTTHKKRSKSNASALDATVHDCPPSTTDNRDIRSQGYDSLEPLYTNKKRLLLGPVDFFRLFVPALPPTAVPESECARYRVEHMLRWRKRVARACLLVQWYTRARSVANRGWSLGCNVRLPDDYCKRRVAFDENLDNKHHDLTAKNEYYEPSVSRDVVCYVRGGLQAKRGSWWQPESVEASAAMSLYQAYTLVGMHAFHWPRDDSELVLHYTKDPVQSLPSLHALLKENPELDFFVVALFPTALKAAIVQVYVRSLPKGVDPSFDRVMQRFIEGDEALRRRKLEVVTQLGIDRERLSFWGRFLLWWLSFLLRATLRKNAHAPQPKYMNDRTSVPALNLSDCGATFHFGGRQQDDSLPNNYVASSVHMESRRNNSFVSRMMLSYFELGGLAKYATDFTFIIAGEEDHELPERALCSSRIVRSTINSLPATCASLNGGSCVLNVKSSTPHRAEGRVESLYWKIFITDPLVVAFESFMKWLRTFFASKPVDTPAGRDNTRMVSPSLEYDAPDEQASIDDRVKQPFQRAVNEVVRILDGVTIPVRKVTTQPQRLDSTDLVSLSPSYQFEQIPILRILNRQDIERYFIASNCCFKMTSVRLIESAAWRGQMFPIDTKSCRLELQNGQFFQQGKDYDGNPVFYFKNMCLGPWRKDNDAVVAAVLHRLESKLEELSEKDPGVRCTLIVLAGRPYQRTLKPQTKKHASGQTEARKRSMTDEKSDANEQSTAASTFPGREDEDESVDEASLDAQHDALDEVVKSAPANNPRIHRDELWNVHTSKTVIERLIEILSAHYPERLSQALIVVGYGNKKYVRSALSGVLSLASFIPSRRTRDKVRFLTRYSDLQSYVDRSQLVTLVGGNQPVDVRHFESK